MSSELRAPLYEEEKLSDKSLKEMKVQVLDSVKCVLKKFNCSYKFQTLHYKVYTIVKNMHGQQLYFRLVHLIERHCKVNVRTNILVNFNVNFLQSVVQAMEDHKTAMGIIMDIFIYLDRAIVQYMDDGSVYNMGIKMFLNHVIKYERIKDHLSDTLLALIAEDRKCGVVDTNLIKRACSVLSGLGHSVYYEHFERPFVLQSVRFFQEIAHKLLSSKECSIADYLNKVEKFITDEEFRACLCFEKSTKNAITKVIKTEMIENKLQLIIGHETTGLSYMLNYEKLGDLKLVYKMVGTIKEGIFVMTQYLSKYFREVGKSIVEKYSADMDAIEFVQRIIDLTEKVSNYLTTCFDQDPIPYKTFSKDYEYIINLDPKMPCHLAKYCNSILSKYSDDSMKHDSLLNVDKALKLFRNLREKDLFEDLYRKLMARRLLDNRFSTEEVETAVISKLEYECGNYFTYKMRNMLKDLVLSKAKNEEFQNQTSGTRDGNEMEFQINVLTSGFWPFHTYQNSCSLPCEVYEQFEHFSRFYICRHIGRKLMLQPDFGTADILVKSQFSGDKKTIQTENETQMRSTILQASTYQMCILLLFNENDHLTFKELQYRTDIKERSLKAALEPMFSRANILIKQPDNAEITSDDIFSVSTVPIYEQEIVKLQPLCIPEEVETEEKKTKETVALDRKDEIDLVIVRLLKKMKIMRHNDLIDQVIKLLSHRFTPSPLLINNRIECLIDRDYLERLNDDVQSYRYLA